MQPPKSNAPCPLCSSPADFFCTDNKKDYHACPVCGGIFMDPEHHLSEHAEKSRYEKHKNDINSPSFREFLKPIADAVFFECPSSAHGLDFGAGKIPVLAHMLQEQGYRINLYDPFFHNHPELLANTYDYITCCEAMEHFYAPAKEFALLRKLLKPDGRLFCMTLLYDEGIHFAGWHYKNDPTHVFFYSARTIEWIKRHFSFKTVQISGRLIAFSV